MDWVEGMRSSSAEVCPAFAVSRAAQSLALNLTALSIQSKLSPTKSTKGDI